MKAVNDSFFINNRLYKSDFNEDYFTRQSGVTCIQSQESIFSSKQHIVIANTKQMLTVLKHKMHKIKANKGSSNIGPGGFNIIGENHEDQFTPKEEYKTGRSAE